MFNQSECPTKKNAHIADSSWWIRFDCVACKPPGVYIPQQCRGHLLGMHQRITVQSSLPATQKNSI